MAEKPKGEKEILASYGKINWGSTTEECELRQQLASKDALLKEKDRQLKEAELAVVRRNEGIYLGGWRVGYAKGAKTNKNTELRKENAALRKFIDGEKTGIKWFCESQQDSCPLNNALRKERDELKAAAQMAELFLRETWHATHTKKSWKVWLAIDGALRKVKALKSEVRK